MNKIYNDASYLPKLSSNKKSSTFIRIVLAVVLVALLASIESCSKKALPIPTGNGIVDASDRGIKEFSLPASVQLGETVFSIDADTYTVTVNAKPGASLLSVAPNIKLAAGAIITPSVGQLVT